MTRPNEPPSARHEAEGRAMISANMAALPPSQRARAALTMLGAVVLLGVPRALGRRLGLLPARSPVREVTRGVYVLEYATSHGESNAVIVRGADGGLFIRSPPPTGVPGVVADLEKLGRPAALLCSVAHDTHADEWKQLFPDALVLSARRDVDVVSSRARVDMVLEEAPPAWLANYGIEAVTVAAYERSADHYIAVRADAGQEGAPRLLLLPCGIARTPVGDGAWLLTLASPATWVRQLLGVGTIFNHGVRFVRLANYLFMGDVRPVEAQLRDVVAADKAGFDGLVFLHGPALLKGRAVSREVLLGLRPVRDREWF